MRILLLLFCLTVSFDSLSEAVINSLSWAPSTSANGLYRYFIYRDDVQIGDTIALHFDDPHVVPGQSYEYKVQAVDNLGLRSGFAIVSITTLESEYVANPKELSTVDKWLWKFNRIKHKLRNRLN